MRAVGIEPDGIVGLSLGELGCSYVDSCFSAEQVVLAAYYCGRAVLETQLIRGSMATVGKSSTFRHIAQICVSASHIHWLSIRIKRTLLYFTVLNW
jgi:malonyl CoA-acyl carrier protein transacylase